MNLFDGVVQRSSMITFCRQKFNNLVSDKKFSEILVGSTWALGARLISTILAMITSIIIVRFYGAEIMGVVAMISSFLILVTIFTILGTETSILRLVPEHLVKYSCTSAFKLYRKTEHMVIGVSLVFGSIIFFSADVIATKVFEKPHLSFYFALASIFIVFKSLMILTTQTIRSLKLIRAFAFMQLLPQGLNLFLLILLGHIWSIMDIPVYAMLGGYALTGLTGWIIIECAFKKRVSPNDFIQPISAKEIIIISLPMLMTATMTFIIGETGVIILGMFKSEAEVGYYAVVVKLATLTTFILTAINSMAAPKFSELYNSGKMDELFYVARKSAKLIFWATTPILLCFVVTGKYVLWLLYSKEFTVAYPALLFLVTGQFLNSISGSTGFFMNMTGRQKQLKNIMSASAAINVLLNFFLVPPFGINGAAIAGMISISFWNIVALVYIKFKHGQTTGYIPSLKLF